MVGARAVTEWHSSDCEKIPTKTKKRPQQDGRRGKVAFRIKSHTCQKFSEGSNKPRAHQHPETPQRLTQCVWVPPVEVGVSSGPPQGQRLWVQQTWVWHKPPAASWRRSPLTPPQSHQNLHRTGEQSLGGHKPCGHQDPGERSTGPTRDWPRLAREYPGVSGWGVGQWWPDTGLGAWTIAVHAWDILKEVTIIFITSTIVWPQVNNREGTQLHPTTENWIKDFLNMASPIRTRPSFPLSQSLPSGSFHKTLTLWKPQSH